MPLTIPSPVAPTDLEETWRDLEPPGLFPLDQDSLWGQMRKVFCDYLQVLADDYYRWWNDLSMVTVSAEGLPDWENQLGIPVNPLWTDSLRRALLQIRRIKGPFTRTRRKNVIELFILAYIELETGSPITFGTGGFALESGGTPFSGEVEVVAGSYSVVEDIPGFSYQVNVLDTIYAGGLDVDGLTRELERITPAPITFSIVSTPTP